ncbi:MAG: cell division FtsK/SpoIIIE [Anaerocolumna sp.]|nr:cell division FtsK/SpoIIIE [Anaerocolumna sp.]
MATGQNSRQKSNNTKSTKSTNSKRTSNSKQSRLKVEEDTNKELYHDEIVLIVTLVVSLLLIFSNFNLTGIVGRSINAFTFGMIGLIAYIFPILLFFGVAFFIANRGSSAASRKLISCISLSIVLSALIQLIAFEKIGSLKISEIFNLSAKSKSGGGLIGGLLCKLLYSLFGTVGTYIILIAFTIVFVMFITGKALFAYLGSKSGESIQQMKVRKLQRSEELARLREEEYENPERRTARTVLLKKNKDSLGDTTDVESGKTKAEDEGFLNMLKKKKGKSTTTNGANLENNFNMEEITLSDIDNIPIYRGESANNGTSSTDNNKTYEDQLKTKFGKQTDNQDDKHRNQDRPGIDDDIQRLLKAAEHDQTNSSHGLNAESVNHSDNLKPNTDDNFDDFRVSLDFEDENVPFTSDKEEHQSSSSMSHNTFSSNIKPKENHETASSSVMNGKADNIDTENLHINQNIEEKKEYIFPPIDLLAKPKNESKGMTDRDLKETALKLQKTLESFGVRVSISNVSCGPSVTRYELQPEQGVKVSRITGLADDIKLNLAAADVRIEAPIPGKAAVGIEVPNKENSTVMFRDLIESKDFKKHPSDIAFAVGKDIGGQTIVTDIGKMPHLLIAGATGSGKSVCINTLIMSILYKAKPSDVRMIMVDPKVVELSVYNGIPHLLIPVVTDPKKASAALNWAVMEMTERYKKFADLGVRDVKGYNEKIATVAEYKDERYQKLPQIVIIVDELADLMMVAPGEVEDAICRLAQMARAAGLHLIIATQRPSVNVITGLIKANIPSRIAFSVSSAIDSRTIIDGSGAEKLLGKGDMLFFPSGYPKPVRVQGAFISDKEVSSVVEFLTSQNNAAEYSEDIANKITSAQTVESASSSGGNDRDDYFIEAGKFIIEKDKASIGMLQRVYKIGFNRAARIMDQLADAGVVGPEEGTKPRKILMSLEEFEQFVDEYV